MFMISIDCVRFQRRRVARIPACVQERDDSTSTMEKGVSKAGSFIVSVSGPRGAVKHGGRRSPLLLERGFQR